MEHVVIYKITILSIINHRWRSHLTAGYVRNPFVTGDFPVLGTARRLADPPAHRRQCYALADPQQQPVVSGAQHVALEAPTNAACGTLQRDTWGYRFAQTWPRLSGMTVAARQVAGIAATPRMYSDAPLFLHSRQLAGSGRDRPIAPCGRSALAHDLECHQSERAWSLRRGRPTKC
jgi:hypothetical protein